MIKGYPTNEGYIGYVNGKYVLFETEDEYLETVKEEEENDDD